MGQRRHAWRNNPGIADAGIGTPVVLGDRIFFRANDGMVGAELWTSDGTAAGTALVKDIAPGGVGSDPSDLTVHQGKIFFFATIAAGHCGLWVSDGTDAGTALVQDLAPPPNPPPDRAIRSPSGLLSCGQQLFLTVDQPDTGIELWFSDGSETGTQLVRDITEGALSTTIGSMTAVQERLFFTTLINNQVSLWTSDGTAAGTTQVMTFTDALWPRDTPGILVLPQLVAVDQRVFFTLNRADTGVELWMSDGTSAGTGIVRASLPDSGVLPTQTQALRELGAFTAIDDRLVFSAYTPERGIELWVSDGTTDGTVPLAEVAPGGISAAPSQMTAVGDKLFVSTSTNTVGIELWSLPPVAAWSSLR